MLRTAKVDEFGTSEGTQLDGSAKLEERAGGVTIVLEVEDAPVGTKAVQIHEKGDCSNQPIEVAA